MLGSLKFCVSCVWCVIFEFFSVLSNFLQRLDTVTTICMIKLRILCDTFLQIVCVFLWMGELRVNGLVG